MNKKLTFEEKQVADLLREEVLKNSENFVEISPKKPDIKDLELMSVNQKANLSPIFSMNEDEILAFVEEFEVKELATLSVAELNHIGKVLGVDPKILTEGG